MAQTQRTLHPITVYRQSKGMSIADFAVLAGVDRTAVSKVENGHHHRLRTEANARISKKTSGELAFEALENWRWSEDAQKSMRQRAAEAASAYAGARPRRPHRAA